MPNSKIARSFEYVHIFALLTSTVALIDYKGYRLIAVSMLPIGSNTLVYGASDGGKTGNETYSLHKLQFTRMILKFVILWPMLQRSLI